MRAMGSGMGGSGGGMGRSQTNGGGPMRRGGAVSMIKTASPPIRCGLLGGPVRFYVKNFMIRD